MEEKIINRIVECINEVNGIGSHKSSDKQSTRNTTDSAKLSARCYRHGETGLIVDANNIVYFVPTTSTPSPGPTFGLKVGHLIEKKGNDIGIFFYKDTPNDIKTSIRTTMATTKRLLQESDTRPRISGSDDISKRNTVIKV